MPSDEEARTRIDSRYIPLTKLGWHFVGNSSKNTAQGAVAEYQKYWTDCILIAESFTPGAGIKFAVYKKVKE